MAYIGNSPENIQRGKRFVYEFKATAGQTVFSGTDLNNQTLDLLEENEMGVYLNGVRLADSDDYTVSGDTLTLVSAASLNDQLTVETQAEIANISSYTRAEADARYINYDGDIVAGDLQISGEVDAGSLIVDTDVLVVDATNDRVGIKNSGTDISGTSLDDVVIGAGSTLAGIVLDGGASSDTAYGFASAGTKVGRIQYINSSNSMVFQTDNANRMTIDGSGRVKIGTTSNTPASANQPGFVFGDNTAGTPTAGVASFVANSAAPLLLTRRINDGNVLGIADDTTTRGLLRVDGGDLNVSSNANLRLSAGGSSAKMTILSGGNVGIGTTNPTTKLEVWTGNGQLSHFGSNNANASGNYTGISLGYAESGNNSYRKVAIVAAGLGDGAARQDLHFLLDNNADGNSVDLSDSKMVIKRSGNVGIGETDPAGQLHVRNDGTGNGTYIENDFSWTAANLGEFSNSAFTIRPRSSDVYLKTSGSASDIRFQAINNANDTAKAILLNPFGGNVGIGTTGPEVPLDVTNSRSTGYSNTQDQRGLAHIVARNGSDAAGRFSSISWVSGGGTQAEGSINLVQTGNYVGDFTVKLRTGANSTDWRERVRIKANGNFGVNTDTGLAGHDLGTLLNVNNATVIGNDTSGSYFGYNASYDGQWLYNKSSGAGLLSFTNSGQLTFRSAASGTAGTGITFTEIFSSDGTGNFMIGNNSKVSLSQTNIFQAGGAGTYFVIERNDPLDVLQVNTFTNTSIARAHYAFRNSTGIVGTIQTSGSSTSYNTSSDHRLKENIEDMTGAITRVKQLSPKRFSWISDSLDAANIDGFIAHEAQTVVPESVTGTHNEVDSDGNAVMQGIDQSKLVPLLTAALKESISKIEALEERIEALEG